MKLNLAALRSALADKATIQTKLDEALGRITTLEGELATANGTATTEKERADALQLQIDEANTTIGQLNGEVSTLKEGQKTVATGTIEKLHELGVPASELPSSAVTGQADADILAKYDSLKGGEKTAFLRANRVALERAAAKAEKK